jgi:hypothetical protein
MKILALGGSTGADLTVYDSSTLATPAGHPDLRVRNLTVTGTAVITSTTSSTGQFLSANGTTAAPAYSSTNDPNTGIYFAANDTILFSCGNALKATLDASGIMLPVGLGIRNAGGGSYSAINFPSNNIQFIGAGGATIGYLTYDRGWWTYPNTGFYWGTNESTPDATVYKVAAGMVGFGGTTFANTSSGGCQPAQDAFGGNVQIKCVTEQLTLNTGAAFTDTTANLLLANSFVLTVLARITTTITTSANWQVGDPTTAGRFNAANSTLTAGTVSVGRVHATTGIASATTGIWQGADAKVRITLNANPGAGVIRLTSVLMLFTPQTS